MGLDMYLTTNVYGFQSTDRAKLNDAIKEAFPKLENKEFMCATFELAYWRKANAIHKWFVDNVQGGKDDCGEYYVDTESLNELKNVCEKVLNRELNPEDVLPSTSGFFFGSTEYDEFYYQNLEDTIEKIQNVLDNFSDGDVYYHSSW